MLLSFSTLFGQTTIRLIKKDGLFYIPCKVNGLALNFIFDTGASDVTISLTEANFMLKNGYLSKNEIIGASSGQLANGEITKSTTILLKEIEVGGIKIYNVRASIINNADASLLLGQSAMAKFGNFQIDPNNGILTISSKENMGGKVYSANNLWVINLANENLSDTIADCTKGIAINPKDTKAYVRRGIAKYGLNDKQGAIIDFTKAIDIDPNDASAYHERGLTKDILDDYQGAIADFTKDITINSQDTMAYVGRGFAKEKLQDHYGAIQDYTQAIIIDSSDEFAYVGRANVLYELQNYQGAIADYTQVIILNPNNANAYYYRGLAKYNIGNHEGACQDWSKAGELGDANAYDMIQKYCQ
jgi:clan AA aspartic protease (TIGR02281 family)